MMKRTIVRLLVVLSFGFAAKAQPTRPTPQLFTAGDGSFSVAFPKPPQKIFEVYTLDVSPDESYAVMFTDLPAPVVDKLELRMRWAWLKKPGAAPVVRNGQLGLEYEENVNPKLQNTGRVFLVKQRTFNLRVRTPLLRALPAAKRLAFRKKIDAFFNSFTIGEIPPARFEAVPVPPADLGRLSEDHLFTSPYFGFTIQLPRGWKTKGHELMVPGQPADIETDPPANASWLELNQLWHRRINRRLFKVYRDWNAVVGEWPVITIRAYRPDEPFESLQKFVERETEGGETWGRKLTGPIKETELGGRKFLAYEAIDKLSTELLPGKPTKERGYITELNGVYLSIYLMNYSEESDEKLLLESLNTIRFTKPKTQ